MSSSETMTRQEDTSPPWTLRDQTEPGTKSRSWCARSQSTRRKEGVRIAHLEAYANGQMTDDDAQRSSPDGSSRVQGRKLCDQTNHISKHYLSGLGF
jgi:hypothetical protein